MTDMSRSGYVLALVIVLFSGIAMADDLLHRDWRLITDGVMGGVSAGQLGRAQVDGRDCLHLQGAVSTRNNGGFLQMALDLDSADRAGLAAAGGLELSVSGNGEAYNLHLRTADLWLPWQAYRSTFHADPGWHTLRIPFDRFTPYRTGKPLRKERLERLGVVAIGRDFQADLCVGAMRFYAAGE